MDQFHFSDYTNIAVRCWLHWAAPLPDNIGEIQGKYRRILAWLLANHLVQAYYRRCGIDIRPFSIGHMYGYGFAVGAFKPQCYRNDIKETALVACSSVRVDPKSKQSQEKYESFEVAKEIATGDDPLWVIDRAAVAALGQRWLPRCNNDLCSHHKDADIYLSIYQIITLLLCMGYISDAILGTYVDCDFLGENSTVSHPLHLAGVIDEPCFTQEYFEIGPTYKNQHNHGAFAWIHRSTGDLLIANNLRVISFEKWCAGSVERGLEFLIKAIG
ncbi:MAG: hypothetical protein WBI48_05440 [Thermacetogeniaceae bacterium]